MSIPVAITKEEIKIIESELVKPQDFVVLDCAVHVKVLLVAQQRLIAGKPVNANIVKGYPSVARAELFDI